MPLFFFFLAIFASTASAVSSFLATGGTEDVDLFLVGDGPGSAKLLTWGGSLIEVTVQDVEARVDSGIGFGKDRKSGSRQESLRELLKEKELLVEDDPVINLYGYLENFKTDTLFQLPHDLWDKNRGLFVKLGKREGSSAASHGDRHG